MNKVKINIFRISIVLASMFILLLLATWLPTMAGELARTAPEFKHLRLPLLMGIYFTAIPFFIAVYNIFKLLKLIEKDVLFSMDSINYLNIIKKCCQAEMVLYFLGSIYLNLNAAGNPVMGILIIAIIFTAFVIYMFIEILKELLLKAVELKSENELTI